jgi:deoxyribodipyrimidine photo-lyase
MTVDQLGGNPRVTIRTRGAPDPDGDAVVYWMQRAQRAADNPALDVAIELGNLLEKPVLTFFGLNPFVAAGNLRHYRFLAEGLTDIEAGLRQRRVPLVLRAYPHHRLLPLLADVRPVMVIGDENPLRQTEGWRERLAQELRVPFWTIDADVVVPGALIEGEQYAARTIRPRIHRHLAGYLTLEPEASARVHGTDLARRLSADAPSPEQILDGLPIDRSVRPVGGMRGGLSAARARLVAFVNSKLGDYPRTRNHPEEDGTSQLSPYLHFGQIGPREVASAIARSGAPPAAVEAFLEQLIVRRELAINFVRHNDNYDRLSGCEPWAWRTLRQHAFDPRPHVYSYEQFDAGATHDPLWNAAQRQMVDTGWMHGYIRMYWAKKILEWSATPEEAFDTAVRLNDRYELDGRDANGYTNIAWAIGGKHDRPWPPRPVYGAIRSMSYASTSRKFDSARYIAQYGQRMPTNPAAVL